jgi:Txe/YoeB family toxin of Txe-Axe toxin-antitoxin module
MSETFNPFDASGYGQENSEPIQSEPVQTEPVAEDNQVAQPESTVVEPTVEATPKTEEVEVNEPVSYEWNDDFSKTIYDKLVNKDISDLADMLYEQKVLSSLDDMSDEDVIKLQMAYEYPELTPEEIEEEFQSKFSVDADFDEDLLTEDEISAKRKQLEKQTKAIQREMKKMVGQAKESLQELRRDIDFPDILSQMQGAEPSEDAINKYLTRQQEEQRLVYEESRKVFESSIDDGLRTFDGFSVNYKDEDVQFDGKYNITQEDKASLQGVLKSFDLESFYGNRYFKEGKYDTKQLAEDVYFLQNRDKILSSMVTQAVSKAKADILKGMKNIDYSNQPRSSSAANTNDYDEMVSAMFRL